MRRDREGSHGCDGQSAQQQGHGEPHKGKDDFRKEHKLNCRDLQVVDKINIFCGKQRQTQQCLNQRERKATLTAVQTNA